MICVLTFVEGILDVCVFTRGSLSWTPSLKGNLSFINHFSLRYFKNGFIITPGLRSQCRYSTIIFNTSDLWICFFSTSNWFWFRVINYWWLTYIKFACIFCMLHHRPFGFVDNVDSHLWLYNIWQRHAKKWYALRIWNQGHEISYTYWPPKHIWFHNCFE